MINFLPIISTVVICIAVMILAFFIDKKIKNINSLLKEIIIGVMFGLVTIYATEFGSVKVIEGALINIRNIGPLTAGIIFGGPSGIIAGLIGGIERWICVYWGGGAYTRLACSSACILSGFIASLLHKFIFEKKKPSPLYGFGIGFVMETIHMVLVFITNMNDATRAYNVVRVASAPMMFGSAFAMLIIFLVYYIFLDKNIEGYNVKNKNRNRNLSNTFQIYLLLVVLSAYFIAVAFTGMIQDNAIAKDIQDKLSIGIADMIDNIRDSKFDVNNLIYISDERHIGVSGGIVICDKDLKILSNGYEGLYLYDLFDNDRAHKPNECFKSTLTIQGKRVPSYCMFTREGIYYVLGFYPVEEAEFHDNMISLLIMLVEIIIFAGVFILIFFLIKLFVVEEIDKVNDALTDITSGNLDRKVEVRSHYEFAILSDDINATVSTLKRYINDAKERINKELEFAKEIQYSSLPSIFPAYPKDHRFDIHASMYTAKEVGGDFYDFYFVENNKLLFLIADVSGKGIPASLFMMQTKSYIKALAESGHDIEEIADKINDKLIESNEAGMFVTAFIIKIDLTTGECEYVNAGHNAPIIRHSNGKAEYLVTTPDFVFTGLDGQKYHKNTFKLKYNDDIFLYTDGVTEANNINKELYGDDRLLAVINNRKENTMKEMLDNVKKQLDFFVGNAEQFDDITMLGFRYIGQ